MSLFEKLAAKAEKIAIDQAFAKGMLRCPKCGNKPTRAPVDAVTLMYCESCGHEELPVEWKPESNAIRAADPDRIPTGTRIRREGVAPGECVWHIPASGKFGLFLFFGLFWTAITAVVSGGFLFGSSVEGKGSNPWFLYPFFILFWSIGLGMLYVAVRNKYARHRINVTRDWVSLRREMFGRVKEKSLVTSEVSNVEQVVFYQQNYEPVYGVEVRGPRGKLRFGTALADEEKAWLVADIKRAVFGEVAASPNAHVSSPEVTAAQRQSSFSFPLPAGPKGHWILGVIFVLIGLGVTAFGLFGGPDFGRVGEESTHWIPKLFDALFSVFSLIPIFVGLSFSVVGVLIVKTTWASGKSEKRLEGDETQVALRTYQHGRVIKEESFPRSSVGGVRATGSGNMNGKPMKRIDMIVDGKAKRITLWTEGDAADVWAADVTRAIGK